MGKHIAKLAMVLTIAALAIAPAAGAYSTPKPSTSGGSKAGQKASGKAATKAGKQLQGKKGATTANGVSFKVHFPKAGKITCTVSHNGQKLGSGSAKSAKTGNQTLKINFTATGKTFLKNHAGAKVKVKCVFKPKSGGPSSTSTVTVTLG